MYRYHPEIESLKCNEDGTDIIYFGEALEIRDYNIKNRNSKAKYVIIRGKVIQVGRIVAECWIGMPDDRRLCATRKDKEKGYHHANIIWAPRGTDPQKKHAKRDVRSKITKEDIPLVEKRLKAGESLRSIAKDYNTSDMSISRIKKRMQ